MTRPLEDKVEREEMKISEFSIKKIIGTSALDWEYFAEVSVTTGMLFWKKTERRQIHRKYADYWHFVDNGQYTPGNQVERLARAYEAKASLNA